ncbi:MAG: hypothetical protein OEM98_14405 [Gammaproteobacteria bacterium]|nr:hypothetical protein [Gammaproteobacteria bacterium]
MARKPNYSFEKNIKAKAKAAKREAKRQAKLAAKAEKQPSESMLQSDDDTRPAETAADDTA